MKTDELREKYLAFFETKGCVRRPSDVLVPRWDPSVLFTPAGMNQFKDHFLGRVKLDFTRATSCQKCLRTGDIENVGRTAYHHTFFEMLGNFSFGDYFKREAILWAWEFLTDPKWLKLDPNRLSATVYVDDREAANIWREEIGLPEERIGYLGEDENFWPANAPSLGPDGVCGPCSEIYYKTDQGDVEIWNLVFTQFNRVGDPPDNLRPLPSKNIDTGMGLERTAAVLQGVETNFHIDLLLPLVKAAAEICGVKYEAASDNGRRLRRIADHLRACTFAVHENVYPGNKEEKYVIRRLLRRAVLDGRQIGHQKPFLHQLVPTVAELMASAYPDLKETTERVAQIIAGEEEHFIGTIDSGLERIEKIFDDMKQDKRGIVQGEDAFEMYQTYGFPPELFETLAAEHNFGFDWPGFQEEMKRHGELSGSGEKNLLFKKDPLEGIKKAMHGCRFLGYETLICEDAKIVAIVAENQLVDSEDDLDQEKPITVVLDKTPFYGEKGGQVGDSGEILGSNFHMQITDTQVDGEFILHIGHLRQGTISLGQTVTARVDGTRRAGIARAHTATHLLHRALRQHLGSHAEQQGSKVDNDLLRFDFTNPKAVDAETLSRIEEDVNLQILQGLDVCSEVMPLEEARKAGAMMLFGEKYPDRVRVVRMGGSSELCGGTHLKNSSQVGLFHLAAEESVSAGTRRITALTGLESYRQVRRQEALLRETTTALKIPPAELPDRAAAMAKEIRKLRKELSSGAAKKQGVSVEELLEKAVDIAGVKVILEKLPDANPNVLRETIDRIRRKCDSSAVLLAAQQGKDKVMLVAGLSRDLVDKGVDAVQWVRDAASEVQGGGGGRPDLAQAGGKLPEKLPDALKKAKEKITEFLQ